MKLNMFIVVSLTIKTYFSQSEGKFIMNIVRSEGYLKYTRFGLDLKYSVN
jgi:hypothetical protein